MRENNTQAWLCILNEENFEIVGRKRIYGIPKNARALVHFTKFKEGDVLVFYIISPRKQIKGIAKVLSPVFEDDKKAPWKDRLYPYRVRISEVHEIAIRERDFEGKISALRKRIPMGTSIMPLGENDLKIIQTLAQTTSSGPGNGLY